VDHLLTVVAWGTALLQALLYAALAPLLVGWIGKLKARLQNRRGAPVLQPWRDLRKLLLKEARVAHTASPLFRAAPYIVFVATWLAAATVPLVVVSLPTAAIADIIVLVGLLLEGARRAGAVREQLVKRDLALEQIPVLGREIGLLQVRQARHDAIRRSSRARARAA